MNNFLVNIKCFTVTRFNTELKYLKITALVFAGLTLSGCITSETSAPLAPQPPEIRHSLTQPQKTTSQNYAAREDVALPKILSMIAAEPLSSDIVGLPPETQNIPKDISQSYDSAKCRINDRFDNKALLAYEWDRNRVAMNVGGSDVSGSGMILSYKIRLQPEKTSKQKCRYNSQWQGIVGSGYNELVLRKDQTVWSEMKSIKKHAVRHLESSF